MVTIVDVFVIGGVDVGIVEVIVVGDGVDLVGRVVVEVLFVVIASLNVVDLVVVFCNDGIIISVTISFSIFSLFSTFSMFKFVFDCSVVVAVSTNRQQT